MRTLLTKKNSTKFERLVAEELKRHHIPFRHRVLIGNREYDFLIGNHLIVEIGNHITKKEKNIDILNRGYSLLDFSNKGVVVNKDKIIRKIQKYGYR